MAKILSCLIAVLACCDYQVYGSKDQDEAEIYERYLQSPCDDTDDLRFTVQTRDLFLIRHGESQWNEDKNALRNWWQKPHQWFRQLSNRFSNSWKDAELVQHGIQDATYLRDWLADNLDGWLRRHGFKDGDAKSIGFITSNLRRATDTATIATEAILKAGHQQIVVASAMQEESSSGDSSTNLLPGTFPRNDQALFNAEFNFGNRRVGPNGGENKFEYVMQIISEWNEDLKAADLTLLIGHRKWFERFLRHFGVQKFPYMNNGALWHVQMVRKVYDNGHTSEWTIQGGFDILLAGRTDTSDRVYR